MAHRLLYLSLNVLLIVLTVSIYSSAATTGWCKAVLNANPNATSGEYVFKTPTTQTVIEVYCEMGLNGGGYTFIKPQFMTSILDSELQEVIIDRTSVLFVPRLCSNLPYYSVLEQLPQFSGTPLKIALNDWTGYTKPPNVDTIGTPYLFVGFIPANTTSQAGEELGVQANGQNLTYSSTSETEDSYVAAFPDFRETDPALVAPGVNTFTNTTFCHSLQQSGRPIPSGRTMPLEYFMFMEVNFGGVGCNFETNAATRTETCIISAAVGFL